MKKLAHILCGTALLASPALAQDAQENLPLSAQVMQNMGRAGLLATMSSNERYGAVQSRVAFGRAIATLAQEAGTPDSGYRDDLSELLTPLNVMIDLNGQGSFLRFASDNRWTDAHLRENAGYGIEPDGEAHGLTVQYLHAPDPSLLWGLGLEVNRNAVDIRHNDGTSDIDAIAIRGDLLKVVNPHWGIALRAAWFEERGKTSIPLPFATLDLDQDSSRFYLQADAVGTYSKADLPALPENWLLRPSFGAVWQKTWFDKATNSLGGVSEGPAGNSEDEYGVAYLRATFEMAGNARIRPNFGFGIEHEFINDYGDYTDEDTYLNSYVGASVRLSRSALLNINYMRYDGVNDNRDKETLVVAFGMSF